MGIERNKIEKNFQYLENLTPIIYLLFKIINTFDTGPWRFLKTEKIELKSYNDQS